MNHQTKTYTSEQAQEMAKEVGDFSADPKHLKREILALKRQLTVHKKDYAVVVEHIKKQDAKIAQLEHAIAQIGWAQ